LEAASLETTTIAEAKALLYAQPVESFVAERDALVKAIRSGGDRALANAVKALRKPSAVAAVVNQVVRADPDGVELILQAAALLRSAQAGALDGTTINTSELQQQYRAAIQGLAQSATSRRVEVRSALEAATIDEASNEDLRTGCLVVVPTPVSIFGSAAPAPTATKAKTEPDSKTEPVDELEERRALHRSNKAAAKEAAKEKAAAAEAERQRQDAEKERRKKLKELQKRHREALQAHLAALDEKEAASQAVALAEQELIDHDDEIESAEQALAELRVRREKSAAMRDRSRQAKSEAYLRVEEAHAAVDAVAETLAALAESQP
jgi:hypothetical protein